VVARACRCATHRRDSWGRRDGRPEAGAYHCGRCAST
jgi:hypothetical protein